LLLEKPLARSPTQEIPQFCVMSSFITMFTKSRHRPYPAQTKPIRAHKLYSPVMCFNVILQTTTRSFDWPLPSGFHTKNLYAFLVSPTLATCPAHVLDWFSPIIFSEEYKPWTSSLCNFLQPLVTRVRTTYSPKHLS
jgi:hypothetical protein